MESWWEVPGGRVLPSGALAVVGPLEETWVTVELHRTVRVVLDLEDVASDGLVAVSLHWPTSDESHEVVRPYGCEATVRYLGDDAPSPLVISRLPWIRPEDPQDAWTESPSTVPSLFAWAGADTTLAYVDAIARLPVDDAKEAPHLGPSGIDLWRGALDESGRAIVEHLTPDRRTWPHEDDARGGDGHFPHVAHVDIGLRR